MASPAIEFAMKLRMRILSRERQAAVRLVHAYGRIYADMKDQIDALLEQIAAMEEPTTGQVWRLSRLQALRRQVADEMNRFAVLAEGEMDYATQRMVEDALRDSRQLTQLALPGISEFDAGIMAHWQRLNADAVFQAIGLLGTGSPLRARFGTEFGEAVADGIADTIISGVAMGWGPAKTAREVRKQFGTGLEWALRNVRTAQLWTYREASRMSYLANSHIVSGWIWISALDERACIDCIAMHGTVHSLDEVLDDHYNGRCTMVPVTVDYADLGYDIPRHPIEIERGIDWFEAQPEAVQREILGPSKYAAWKAGEVNIDDFIRRTVDDVYGEMLREASLKEILGDRAREFYRR